MLPKNGILLLAILCCLTLLGACDGVRGPVRRVGALDVGTAYRVYLQGDTAYLAVNAGLAVVDVSDPRHPRRVALIELAQAAFGVYAREGLVYIAGPADGLVIADVRDPAAPQVLGAYAGSGINEVCVSEHVAYAGTQQGDLLVIDVADPAHPALLASYAGAGGMGLMVACLQEAVYFSTSEAGLQALDVSDPANPLRAALVPRTQGAKDSQVVADWLYLSCAGNGARILDISEPLAPKSVAAFNNGGEAWGVGGDSRYLWVGDLQEGVEIYDVSDPPHPELVARDGAYAPHDIFFQAGYAYLADQDRGLVILEFSGATLE